MFIKAEFEAAHCRKGQNLRRHIAANRNKLEYRLSPTVSIALAMHQPLKRSEQLAATRRKGRNLRWHIAANRNKLKYRLSPTVPLILAMSQPLKRSELPAAVRRKGRNLKRHIAAKVGTVSGDPPPYLPRSAMRRAISCSFMPTIASPRSSDSSAIILASV